MDEIIGEQVSWITFVKWLSAILIIFGTAFNFVEFNDYQQTADQVIRRYGGLTENAQKKLTTLSQDNYNGIFEIYTFKSNNEKIRYGQQVQYGEKVYYSICVYLPLLKTKIFGHTYSTVSEIRQE